MYESDYIAIKHVGSDTMRQCLVASRVLNNYSLNDMSFSPFAALLLINLNCFVLYFTAICHYQLTNKLLRGGDCNHVAQTPLGHQSDWSQPQISHAFVWNRPKYSILISISIN